MPPAAAEKLAAGPANCDARQQMNAARIQAINDEMLRRTGVDFSRYRSEELAETVANAVTFPLFFMRSISRPVAAFLLLTIVAMFVIDSAWFSAFLVFPGMLLAILNGVLLGLVLFARRIRTDMERLFAISADLSVQVMQDIGTARRQLGDGAGFPSLLEILQAVNAVILLPVVIRTLQRRVPLLGGLAARITERFFTLVDARLAAAIESRGVGPAAAAPASPAEISAWLQSAQRAVEAGRGLVSQVVDKAAQVVAFPFLTLFVIGFGLSWAILYGAWALMG